MRIAIVNDLGLAVEAMRRVLTGAGHQVAWVAGTGAEAVARCGRDRPDLVLMDLILPEVDGVEATRQIMAQSPCAIVIVTANVGERSSKIFEALGAGALDVAGPPVLGGAGPAAATGAFLAKIETIRRLIGAPNGPGGGAARGGRSSDFKAEGLVVLGASAGGPAALARVLGDLPADFPAALAIVQHVDAQFVPGLAEWLGGQTPLRVRLAEEGDRPEAGTVLLAGRDFHLVLTGSRRWGYSRGRADALHRPSVDVFFQSVGLHWKGVGAGVLLTGMGRDGAAGLKTLRKHGFHTLAQDAATSAVYGMPKAAAELSAATEILALDKIGPRLTNIMTARKARS